jgi:hypothetical protein
MQAYNTAVVILQYVSSAMGAVYICPSSASEGLFIVPSLEPTVEIHVPVHLSTFFKNSDIDI